MCTYAAPSHPPRTPLASPPLPPLSSFASRFSSLVKFPASATPPPSLRRQLEHDATFYDRNAYIILFMENKASCCAAPSNPRPPFPPPPRPSLLLQPIPSLFLLLIPSLLPSLNLLAPPLQTRPRPQSGSEPAAPRPKMQYVPLRSFPPPTPRCFSPRPQEIHFWIGSRCPSDKAGSAAALSTQLQQMLAVDETESYCRVWREVQGEESASFLSLFPSLSYRPGGSPSGWRRQWRSVEP